MEEWYTITFWFLLLVLGLGLAVRTSWRLSAAWLVYMLDQALQTGQMLVFGDLIPWYCFLANKLICLWLLFNVQLIEHNETQYPKWPILAVLLEFAGVVAIFSWFSNPVGYHFFIAVLSYIAIINLSVATVWNFRFRTG